MKNNQTLKLIMSIICLIIFDKSNGFAQVWNNTYTEVNNLTIIEPKGKSIVEDDCRTVVVNSVKNNDVLGVFN